MHRKIIRQFHSQISLILENTCKIANIGCTASEERYLQSLLGRIESVRSIDCNKEFEEYKKQIDVLLKKEEDSK